MKKKMKDQSCGNGNRDNASGYATKVSPGPLSKEIINELMNCQFII